ncbi:MAG: alpha/beta fold hydrolase [Candidatus Thorarchaeota archaeon]|jgi:pimeloyl-ACP methyl ester carboxylesterase
MPKATVNGINIDYRVEGQGEPLIMIAGFSSEKNGWWFQTKAFKKYYRIITFDNRGVGKSDKPTGPYTVKRMADDAIGLMDHLGIEKAHVLGISMGGMIAQELAINHPERVDKLVLASTFTRRDETSGFTSEASKRLETFFRSLPNEVEIRRGYVTAIDLTLNKRFYRILAVPLTKTMIRLSDTSALNGLVGQRDAALAHNTADRLKLIKAPTLVITGTNDRLVKPISSEVIANLVPKAKLVKVDGGSHGVCVEMRSEFNKEVLDFLTN